MATKTVQQLARELADAFEGTERANGDEIRILRDGSPEWMREVVHTAHGDMFPDDYRYEAIENAAEHIAEAEDPEEGAHDFADGAVDVYNGARLAWLASHGDRAGYVDEAREEIGTDAEGGILGEIGRGQYFELIEVYGLVLQALTERAEADEAEAYANQRVRNRIRSFTKRAEALSREPETDA